MMMSTSSSLAARSQVVRRTAGVVVVPGASRARSSSSSASASSSAKDASTTPSSSSSSSSSSSVQSLESLVIDPLEKGLSYEIKTGCANARGKKFANFQQFLTAQLTRLSEDALVKNSLKSSSIVRRMKEDGVLYGQLPANERERMLINMRGALPIVMAEVNANERSMSGRESSTSDGNGTRVAGWQPPASAKRTKSAPSPQSGVLSSSTVEKETLSKEQHKPIKI